MRSDRKRGDQDTDQKSHVDLKYGGSTRNIFPLYDMDHSALGRRPFGGSCKKTSTVCSFTARSSQFGKTGTVQLTCDQT
jgi:hypothetical protein